ncbi:MAG: NAD(P)-dependent oxidoreductase [Xanthomonadales bacterium]|nr:NAD(P)-dependent oxidoreductase [Xanthomonadales bacterium]
MKLLLTGSAGRIGQAIRAALEPSHSLIGLDRLVGLHTDCVADISDRAAVRRALVDVDAIIHCAALHAPHVGLIDDAEFHRINVLATRQLGELALDAGVTHLIHTSTTALYGHASTPDDAAAWIDEDTVPQARTIYHRSKLDAEAELARLSGQYGLRVTVLRMSRCFPEAANLMACYRLHRGIDARDVASAHACALARRGDLYARYVISGDPPFESHDRVDLKHNAAAVLHRRAPQLVEAFARRGWPLPTTIDRVYSPARAMRDLDWRPRFGPEEVLRQYDAGSPEVLAPEQERPCVATDRPDHDLDRG